MHWSEYDPRWRNSEESGRLASGKRRRRVASFCDPATLSQDIRPDFERHPVEDLLDKGYTPCFQCFPELNNEHRS